MICRCGLAAYWVQEDDTVPDVYLAALGEEFHHYCIVGTSDTKDFWNNQLI
jgi:hypothetical protein